MKEVYIISLYSPEWWSGIEKVVNEVSKAIANTDTIKCTCIFSWKENLRYLKNNVNYIQVGVPQYPWINHFFFMLKLWNILKNNKIDVLLDNIWASAFYLLFHKKHFKLIPILHWTWKDYHKLAKYFHFKNIVEKLKYYAYSRFNLQCWNIIIRKSDKIITLSKYLAEDINKYNKIEMDNIKIIYNWYDKTNIKLLNNTNWKLDVLFISNDHARKWIDILENVAKSYIHNKKVNFYVIWKLYESALINIHSLWKMARKDLYKLMAKSDIIFLPSYCEWQPLVIFEAMWLWCIPIISKECHMDMLEWTIFEKNISINNKVSDYIRIISKILQSENINIIRKKSQTIINKYDWEKQAREYKNFIESI